MRHTILPSVDIIKYIRNLKVMMGAPPLLISATTFTKFARSATTTTALTNLTNSGIFGNTSSSLEARHNEERY